MYSFTSASGYSAEISIDPYTSDVILTIDGNEHALLNIREIHGDDDIYVGIGYVSSTDKLTISLCSFSGVLPTNSNCNNHEFTVSDYISGGQMKMAGVSSNTKLISYSIYPNPSKGLVIIDMPSEMINSEAMICDMTGRVIRKTELCQSTTCVDISGLAKGSYVFKLYAWNKLVGTKLVIKE